MARRSKQRREGERERTRLRREARERDESLFLTAKPGKPARLIDVEAFRARKAELERRRAEAEAQAAANAAKDTAPCSP